MLRKIGHVLGIFSFLAAIAGSILIPIFAWDLIITDGSPYCFYGYEMEFRYIAPIMIAGLLPFGLIGGFYIAKLIKTKIRHSSWELQKKQKMGLVFSAFFILGWGLLIGNNYFPNIPENLGWIKPTYGPYIQYGADDSVIISWDTRQPAYSIVKWGEDRNNLVNSAEGGEFFTQTGQKSHHHSVRLLGIQPGQIYYYQIPDFKKEVYQFKTAPTANSGESVVFSIVGDTQYGYRVSQKNVALMKVDLDKLNFAVIAGDVVHADNNYKDWYDLFSKKSYGGISAEIPVMVATGNHESYCFMLNPDCVPRKNFLTYFQNFYPNPSQNVNDLSSMGYYYSWNYSNVHMVALDSFHPNGGMLNAEQIAWLEQDLARNQNMWKFIYFHVPLYSLMSSNPNLTLINTLQTIFETYNVDAVFTGHDHVFEAYRVNSIYHFLVGGGGGTLEPYYLPKYGSHQWPGKHITADQLGAGFEDVYAKPWFLEGETSHHYMKVLVEGNQASFTAIRTENGEIIASFNATRNFNNF
jgi:hypothetical protein